MATIAKKKWMRIIAPAEFRNQEIGETLVNDPAKAIGRTIKVYLGNLIGDIRRQNVYILFRIKEVKGDQLNAEVHGYEVVESHLKRLVRKGKEKLDDSFEAEFKDKTKIAVKPFILAKAKTKRSISTLLRKKTREFTKDFCAKNDFSKLVNAVTTNRFQSELKSVLKKIYPVSAIEIRKLNRI